VLSGGSTLFPNFAERLEDELSVIVKDRLSLQNQNANQAVNKHSEPVTVNVRAHEHQRYAVFSGGALLASLPDFDRQCVSRQQYLEVGPSACRQSKVFAL
jgi:actin-related protein 3